MIINLDLQRAVFVKYSELRKLSLATIGTLQIYRWTHGISICLRHLVTSKESSKPIYFGKTYFTSYVRSMFWATILYKYHLDELLIDFFMLGDVKSR